MIDAAGCAALWVSLRRVLRRYCFPHDWGLWSPVTAYPRSAGPGESCTDLIQYRLCAKCRKGQGRRVW